MSRYGVEPLVIKLLDAGANPNCTNSIGWTPLLEVGASEGMKLAVHALCLKIGPFWEG